MEHRSLATVKLVIVAAALFATGLWAVRAPVAAQAPGAASTAASVNAGKPPRLPDGRPDLQGIWSFATVTPLERPDDLAGKSVLTDAEAAEYVKQTLESVNVDRRREGTGAYNEFWFERARGTVPSKGTSLIVDPPDGRLPPLTPQGRKRASAWAAYQAQDIRGPLDGPKTRPLRERCIWWDNEGPPLTPFGFYNENVQILQNQGHVVIFMEMIHDARIIPLDGRPHVSRSIPQLLGDSRGRWEGDTLIIDTTNLRDKADFIDPGSFTEATDYRGGAWGFGREGTSGFGPRMHLVERLRRFDADTLLYEYTVNDPTIWTKPWTAQLFLTKSRERESVYEYACHEGNYAVANILSAARAEEKRTKGR